ncbi:hypothetical protein BHM03_00052619 [Ensete ventricosum]|nr:hypothetical protein BHM03_00052619 [Ensete ventricosum]
MGGLHEVPYCLIEAVAADSLMRPMPRGHVAYPQVPRSSCHLKRGSTCRGDAANVGGDFKGCSRRTQGRRKGSRVFRQNDDFAPGNFKNSSHILGENYESASNISEISLHIPRL